MDSDPQFYPDPARFDPDRWLPDRPQPQRGAYLPFGAGVRGCIGEPLAWAQATITLRTLARHWHLHPAPDRIVRPAVSGVLLTPN
ncbi:cytochrome P450 [Streptomyces sp. NPDC048417]|uniref:cytochrome P450 n=1 Tax=Streptomyces sp. NPDC048417 TaxID=3155387 RepID=UPI003440D3E6